MEPSSRDSDRVQPLVHPTSCCCGIKIGDALKLVSNITVPLIIGIFTVIIAIQQQNVAQLNRDKDAAQALELRKQDLERARLLRIEDKETARLQREEDKDTARHQREADREEARLQRELQMQMANDKLLQEHEVAERHRNLSENQRAHEFNMIHHNHMNDLLLEDERQKENVLVKYQRELATFLLDYRKMIFASNPVMQFVLQMKTRAALRVLDSNRRTILVQSLKQAEILDVNWNKSKALFYKANVSGVHFGHPPDIDTDDFFVPYRHLFIEMADARHSTFRYINVSNLRPFDSSNLDYTDWSFSQIKQGSFENELTVDGARFFRTTFTDVSFGRIQMNRASFQYNLKCVRCLFTGTWLLAAHLDHSTFVSSQFSQVSMADANMSSGYFTDTLFDEMNMDRVDLSGADLRTSKFIGTSMVNCSMFGTILKQAKFTRVNLTGCKGFGDQFHSLMVADQLTLPNGTLISIFDHS